VMRYLGFACLYRKISEALAQLIFQLYTYIVVGAHVLCMRFGNLSVGSDCRGATWRKKRRRSEIRVYIYIYVLCFCLQACVEYAMYMYPASGFHIQARRKDKDMSPPGLIVLQFSTSDSDSLWIYIYICMYIYIYIHAYAYIYFLMGFLRPWRIQKARGRWVHENICLEREILPDQNSLWACNGCDV